MLFYAGCRYSLEESLRGTVRTPGAPARRRPASTVGILPEAGCCGGLAYHMGYRDEFAEAGERMLGAGPRPA